MDTIASRIKKALEIRNMKQSELCELTGIGKSSVSTYISGAYEPKQRNIYKIAKALNVSEPWLMGNDVEMERQNEVVRLFAGVNNLEPLTDEELTLVNKFRSLDEKGKHTMKTILNVEFSRCNLELRAAHERTDIEITEEGIEHDNAIMDDEEFWSK